jgi:ABC-2 type transport system ATP-binding protein
VTCGSPQDALERIAGLAGVRDAALFGRDLHVVTPDAETLAPVVREALAELGVETVERIAPSLEDVFVSLIEAKDRAEGTQREVRR